MSTSTDFCLNVYTSWPVARYFRGGDIGVMMVVFGSTFIITSVLILYWIKRQERLAQMGDHLAVKSVIFPVFVNVLWGNAFANLYIGVIMITLQAPVAPISSGAIWAYSLMWGMQHAIIEGVAFMLMQKGLGYHAALTSAKYALVWGVVAVAMENQLLRTSEDSSSHFALELIWESMLMCFYCLLWLCPQKYLFRRPASMVYAQLWFLYRFLSIILLLLINDKSSKAVGMCGDAVVRYFLFAIFQPLVVYRTLLRDSRWWQGLRINMGVVHYLSAYYDHRYISSTAKVGEEQQTPDTLSAASNESSSHFTSIPGASMHSGNGICTKGRVVVLATSDDEDDFLAASVGIPHTTGGLFSKNSNSGKESRNDDVDIDVEGAGIKRALQTKSPFSDLNATKHGSSRSKKSNPGVPISGPLQGLNVNLHSAQSLADTLDVIKSQKGVKLLNFAYIKLDSSKLLGQGSFSKVYRGTYKQQECAIKLIFTVDLTVDVIQRVAAESQILSSIQNANVVTIYGVAVLPPSVCILLELCYYGSLSDVIRGGAGKQGGGVPGQFSSKSKLLRTNYADMLFLALGCARGLTAVHGIGADVIHRDVKSYNFLVDHQLNCKVADLELGIMQMGSKEYGSRTMEDSYARINAASTDSPSAHSETTQSSNLMNMRPADEFLANWLAPELIVDPMCTYQASDVYSFGFVLWELISRGRIPFDHIRSQQTIRQMIVNGERPDVVPYEGSNDERVLQLMRDCWGSDPKSRPTMAKVTERLEYLWKHCICYDFITETETWVDVDQFQHLDVNPPLSGVSSTSVDGVYRASVVLDINRMKLDPGFVRLDNNEYIPRNIPKSGVKYSNLQGFTNMWGVFSSKPPYYCLRSNASFLSEFERLPLDMLVYRPPRVAKLSSESTSYDVHASAPAKTVTCEMGLHDRGFSCLLKRENRAGWGANASTSGGIFGRLFSLGNDKSGTNPGANQCGVISPANLDNLNLFYAQLHNNGGYGHVVLDLQRLDGTSGFYSIHAYPIPVASVSATANVESEPGNKCNNISSKLEKKDSSVIEPCANSGSKSVLPNETNSSWFFGSLLSPAASMTSSSPIKQMACTDPLVATDAATVGSSTTMNMEFNGSMVSSCTDPSKPSGDLKFIFSLEDLHNIPVPKSPMASSGSPMKNKSPPPPEANNRAVKSPLCSSTTRNHQSIHFPGTAHDSFTTPCRRNIPGKDTYYIAMLFSFLEDTSLRSSSRGKKHGRTGPSNGAGADSRSNLNVEHVSKMGSASVPISNPMHDNSSLMLSRKMQQTGSNLPSSFASSASLGITTSKSTNRAEDSLLVRAVYNAAAVSPPHRCSTNAMQDILSLQQPQAQSPRVSGGDPIRTVSNISSFSVVSSKSSKDGDARMYDCINHSPKDPLHAFGDWAVGSGSNIFGNRGTGAGSSGVVERISPFSNVHLRVRSNIDSSNGNVGRNGINPSARYDTVTSLKDTVSIGTGIDGVRNRCITSVGDGTIDSDVAVGYDDRLSVRNGSVGSKLSQFSRGSVDDVNIHYIFGDRTHV